MTRRHRVGADPVGSLVASSLDRMFFADIVDAVVAVGDYVRQEIGVDDFPSSRAYLASLVSTHKGEPLEVAARRVRVSEADLLRCLQEIRLLLVHQPQYATALLADPADPGSFCIYHRAWNRRPRTVPRCEACPCLVEVSDVGRPRQYCSDNCRTRAYRRREAAPRSAKRSLALIDELGVSLSEAHVAALRAFLRNGS